MITNLHIRNFKSIKDLEIDCARVNIFIGEPNTGKSNIIEALGMMSMIHKQNGINSVNSVKEYIRADDITNLFYNKIIDNPISIDIKSSLGHDILAIIYLAENEEFEITCSDLTNNRKTIEAYINKDFRNNRNPKYNFFQSLPIRFYRYKERTGFPSKEIDFLNPPDGNNLLKLIQTRKDVKEYVIDLFSKYDYKYQSIEDVNKIYFNIDIGGELISIPYHLLSDTLQRIIFYFAAISTNKNAAILLEEPESHVFPFYNEQLALMIADNSNQFFIATHNPYFLNMLINKTPLKELNVFKVITSGYQTHADLLDNISLQKFVINDNDIILNIDRLGVD